MNSRTIEIIVSPIGEIQIDAVGFTGPDCEKATKFLEEALGIFGEFSGWVSVEGEGACRMKAVGRV